MIIDKLWGAKMRGVWPERNDRDIEAIKCVWECEKKKVF